MGNMMYTVVAGEGESFILFWLYRVVSFYLLMTLVTIFSAVRFASPSVPNYADRNNDTFQRDFGLFCYVWVWAAGIISQCMAVYVIWKDGDAAENTKFGTNRDVFQYLRHRNFAEAHQLMEFGVKVDFNSMFDFEGGNVE